MEESTFVGGPSQGCVEAISDTKDKGNRKVRSKDDLCLPLLSYPSRARPLSTTEIELSFDQHFTIVKHLVSTPRDSQILLTTKTT